MMVGSYDVRWDWDAKQRLFLRSQLGSPHELTDGQASADTVVVLVLAYGTSRGWRTGGPDARNGSSRRVQRRAQDRGPVDAPEPHRSVPPGASGQPILLAPGRTWVELVDAQHNLTTAREGGGAHQTGSWGGKRGAPAPPPGRGGTPGGGTRVCGGGTHSGGPRPLGGPTTTHQGPAARPGTGGGGGTGGGQSGRARAPARANATQAPPANVTPGTDGTTVGDYT